MKSYVGLQYHSFSIAVLLILSCYHLSQPKTASKMRSQNTVAKKEFGKYFYLKPVKFFPLRS